MPVPALQPMPRAEIEAGVKSFPKWFYPFDLGQGVHVEPTDSPLGKVNAAGYVRKHAPLWKAVLDACGGSLDGLSVLDAGCFQGYWSIEAARAGASKVVGFDLRPEHIEQASFCARAIGFPNVEFKRAELFDIESFGEFDVVLLYGVLYHVDQPIELLRRARRITRKLIAVNTDVLPLDEPVIQLRYEDPAMELNSATGALVALPSVSAVVRMLRHTAFGQVEVLPPADAESYRTWRRAVFLARPTADGLPEPAPASVWKAGEHGYGERKLDWIPSGADRAPLRKLLGRKLGRLFGGERAPRSET